MTTTPRTAVTTSSMITPARDYHIVRYASLSDSTVANDSVMRALLSIESMVAMYMSMLKFPDLNIASVEES